MKITEEKKEEIQNNSGPVLNGNYFETNLNLTNLKEDANYHFPLNTGFSKESLPLLGRAILDYGILFPFIVRFTRGQYYILSHIGIFRALKFIHEQNLTSQEEDYAALVFSADDEHSLILAMTESLEFRYLNPFIEGEILAILKFITGNTYRNLSLMLDRSKSRIEALVTIARMRPDLRIKILHKFPRPPLEFLEEMQRADRHGNSEFISALLHSDGKQETLRLIKKKFSLSRKRERQKVDIVNEKNQSLAETGSSFEMVLEKIPRREDKKAVLKRSRAHRQSIKQRNRNSSMVSTKEEHFIPRRVSGKTQKQKLYEVLSYLDEEIPYLKELIESCFEVKLSLAESHNPSLFKECLARELSLRSLSFQKDNYLPYYYKGLQISEGFFLDFLVEKSIPVLVIDKNAEKTIEKEKLRKSLDMSGLKVGLIVDDDRNNNVPSVVYHSKFEKE